MTAQSDVELFPWLLDVSAHAGSFLKYLGEAAKRADDDNYRLLRPVLLELQVKYPKYGVEERARMIADGWQADAAAVAQEREQHPERFIDGPFEGLV